MAPAWCRSERVHPRCCGKMMVTDACHQAKIKDCMIEALNEVKSRFANQSELFDSNICLDLPCLVDSSPKWGWPSHKPPSQFGDCDAPCECCYDCRRLECTRCMKPDPITGQLTNMRASGTDETVRLTPPRQMTLEEAIGYVQSDELIEVTPSAIRLRKAELDSGKRKAQSRKAAKA